MRELSWWGWGAGAPQALPPHALAYLSEIVGPLPGRPSAPVALEAVRLSPPALPAAAADRLREIVGAAHVVDDRLARVRHAAGKGYPDLIAQRAGECGEAPDAIVLPGSHAEVRAVLEACAAASVAVVPFGGGTSVVGGVAPLRGPFAAVVSLDLGRLDRLVAVDRTSLTAVLEAGVRLPRAEALLGAQGLTLGHTPQSFEFATVGGCVATRSAGQGSTGYGRIDALVRGLRCAAPVGDVDVRTLPGTAAGPALRELLVGSEGTLGVLTETALRVRPAPVATHDEGWLFHDFAEGVAALRALAQHGAAPDIARLSDEAVTRATFALAGLHGTTARLGQAYIGARGYRGGCLAICGFEGETLDVSRRRARAARLLRRHGGLALGQRPGAAWRVGRYDGPDLRDALLGHELLVETLETAGPWSGIEALYRATASAIAEALAARGTPGLVLCHVSHLYATGGSLYFTFIARREPDAAIEQWRAVKTAATDAIVAAGGTITHHHGVGRDHAPWLPAEVGSLGIELLRAAKATLDPAGILNPGKLLSSEA